MRGLGTNIKIFHTQPNGRVNQTVLGETVKLSMQ